MSNDAVSIASRLKDISERQEKMQQHHKSGVLASTNVGRSSNSSKATRTKPSGQRSGLGSIVGVGSHDNEEDTGPYESKYERELTNEDLQLLDASKMGDTSKVKLLLAQPNADPNPRDIHSRTPLWLAVNQGHPEVVELLLKTGIVDLNVTDRKSVV